MNKYNRLYWIVAAGLLLSACAPRSQLVIRNPDLARQAKKIAVLPFQNANSRASEDTSFQTSNTAMTLKFMDNAQPLLSGRYEFVPQEQIMAELKKRGFEGFDPNKSAFRQAFVQPTGYGIPEAIDIGKSLNADAVFLGVVAMTQAKPPFAISVRMIDVKTGKVTVAVSAQSSGGMSFSPWNAPMRTIAERIAKEVP